jgi:hypothetical protein
MATDTHGPETCERRYHLPRQIYACRANGAIVFLDTRIDRYFGLGGPEIWRLFDLVDGLFESDRQPQHASASQVDPARLDQVAEKLIRRGLLCRNEDEECRDERSRREIQCLPSLQIDPPQLAEATQQPPRLRDVVNFLSACLRAAWSLRRLSLEVITSEVTSRRRKEGPTALPETLALAMKFQRLRRWLFSERDRCLFNSLSLVYFLQRYGYFPNLVIGVQTAPFAAHAWVQRDRIVLDGDPEKVGHFSPILVA